MAAYSRSDIGGYWRIGDDADTFSRSTPGGGWEAQTEPEPPPEPPPPATEKLIVTTTGLRW